MATHDGRVAVVTGAARGIGQATCHRLAERGAAVVGIDRVEMGETQRLVEKAGGSWFGFDADVTDETALGSVAEQVRRELGACHILVNNAGIFPQMPFEEMTFADWRRVLSVNLDSQFLTCQVFLPFMKEAGWGRIVNLTSDSVQVPLPGYVAYKASKLGIVGLTRGLSSDVAEYGVTVNAVSPSLTRTPGTAEAGTDAMLPTISAMQAIKKAAEPDDVVGAILFLSSEDSYFVTGQTLYADGGLAYP
jgi:NAD(P)-dependent dehydrogenase (short-subunit alcohol dehydrogenase family)